MKKILFVRVHSLTLPPEAEDGSTDHTPGEAFPLKVRHTSLLTEGTKKKTNLLTNSV